MLDGRTSCAKGEKMNIKRSLDDTSIKLISIDSKSEKALLGFAGFGYTIECPLLYYSSNIAFQYSIDYLGFDCNYPYNEQFKEKNEQQKEEYFKNDVELICEYLNSKRYLKRIFIGKSMGTTIINRLIENNIIKEDDSLIFLTPGIEWNKIINNIRNVKNRILIVGSKGDPLFIEYDYSVLKNNKNIEIMEYETENHVMEIGNLQHDLNVLTRIMNRIEAFIKENV